MRHEVKTFAQCMETKLKKNDHKGGWEGTTNETLFRLLRQEVDELEQALENEPELNVVFEAADIANFAMMIAWNALRQLVTPPVEEQERIAIQSTPSSRNCDCCGRSLLYKLRYPSTKGGEWCARCNYVETTDVALPTPPDFHEDSNEDCNFPQSSCNCIPF